MGRKGRDMPCGNICGCATATSAFQPSSFCCPLAPLSPMDVNQVVEVGTYEELASKPDGHFRRLVQYQMLA